MATGKVTWRAWPVLVAAVLAACSPTSQSPPPPPPPPPVVDTPPPPPAGDRGPTASISLPKPARPPATGVPLAEHVDPNSAAGRAIAAALGHAAGSARPAPPGATAAASPPIAGAVHHMHRLPHPGGAVPAAASGPAAVAGEATPPPTPAASAAAWCPVIGDVASPAECDRVNQIKANLATGSAAFNAPAEMQRRQTVRLRLVIDRHAGSAAPAAAVDPLDGATVAFATKVGRLMRAELGGEGFTVKPLTPPEQDLYAADQAQWEWQVTATDAGDRVLTLKTFVEIKGSDGTTHPVGEINTENRTIHVIVPADQSWSDRIDAAAGWMGKGTNLAKALAGLLGALLAVWLAVKKFRTPPPSPG